jgi:HEXXH motif-containing protein
VGFSGWTADGRAFIRPNATVRIQPVLEDRIPLDMQSPHARSVDLVGGSRPVFPARPAPSAETRRQSVARVEAAWQGIRATPGSAADAVAAWTRVVVVQSEASGKFWSGSNGQYIGRVVLANVDSPGTPVEDVADALVHEAIHGFLYMHECVQPWVRGYSLYTDEGAIISPWSGALLPVRPFMQACFVWYGLAMFWAQHMDGDIFARDRARFLLFRAVTGFRKGALADHLQPWRDEVEPEMVELIAELQRIVISLLD